MTKYQIPNNSQVLVSKFVILISNLFGYWNLEIGDFKGDYADLGH